jgi:uncharacterized short protein YbdD (DUF466 family)
VSALRRFTAAAGRVLRAVLGAPDYERYLAHARAHHPDQTPLSRAEFLRARLDERYAKPGARCC